jgi:hypothetical protein
MAFLLKYQCYDQLFTKFSFVLSQKRPFFAKIFGENILKIITSVPAGSWLGRLYCLPKNFVPNQNVCA